MRTQAFRFTTWPPLLACTLGVVCIGMPAVRGQEVAAKHPNLLLNRAEIEQVKAKIEHHDWAARLFERVKSLADDPSHTNRIPREAALVYALTGDRRYADLVRRSLVGSSRYYLGQYEKLNLKSDPDFGAWGPWATWAWAYDLTYDTFSPDERATVERLLRTAARTITEGLKLRSTTPNLVFEKHWKVGLIGYCLGDRQLIEWGLNDPGFHGPSHGGFYQVLDTMIKDRYFWGEAPIYALHYDLHGMLALAEAARHYDGTDLYGYVSKKSGASIKGLIDGYLRLAFPRENTGVEGGSVRLATFGDGSTSYTPQGGLADTFLVNPVGGGFGEPTLSGELEIAYHHYHDPGYAWLISLNPKRDQYIGSAGQGHVRPIWGFAALTHGDPLPESLSPPDAPSALYPSQGVAVLRADESGHYWTEGALAAVVRLGALVGHGHKDYFELILHGKGRLLYPDLNVIQYEPTWLNWTHEGIAHNTLVVDRRSPQPGPFTTRHEFTPEAKFFALSGSAFPNVRQTRALLMTPDYLADVFRAADSQGRDRCFDWVLHGLGRLYPGNPAAYRPTDALVPYYWWIDNERGRATDATWQADWVQHSGGVTPGVQRFDRHWFEQTVGVRLTMLGSKGTEIYTGDGPITNGPPYHRLEGNAEGSAPLVVARRRGPTTTFAAVHEPYDKRASIRRVSRIQETEAALGLAVASGSFSDRVLIAFRPDQEQILRGADGEVFTFRDHGYIRVAGQDVTVRGPVTAFRLRVSKAANPSVKVNGRPETVRREGEFLVFGKAAAGSAGTPAAENPREQGVALHYYIEPEEVHLKAGGEKETALHFRCVGQGEAQGKLRMTAPDDITIEPGTLDLGKLRDGGEKIIRVRVKARPGAASALHAIRIEPVGDTPAAVGELPVSVGVVVTEDNRVPLAAQWVVRAPGYIMKVDHFSGVAYSLLDADGHRRHGAVYNTNFCFGMPGVERAGQWLFRYHEPCRFVWEGKNTLTVGSGSAGQDARLRYTFHEDRIVMSLVPPTKPTEQQTMWLGNFDALGKPRHNGTQKAPHLPVEGSWFFFPHPVYRQGVLLLLPEKTPLNYRGSAVNFPLRAGQEVTLRFATEGELPRGE